MKTILCLLLVISYATAQERIGLDPAIRGVWNIYATSEDKGKTLNYVEDENGNLMSKEFAVAKATEIVFADGKKVEVKSVLIIEDDEGNPANLVDLNNGNKLAISKKPGQAFVLIQVYDSEFEEKSRFLIAVTK